MKQKMFIPTIGFEFTLESDWNFDLHAERRNKTLISKGMRGTENYSADGYLTWDLLEMKQKIMAVDYPDYEDGWYYGSADKAARDRNDIKRKEYRDTIDSITAQYPEETRSVKFLPVMLEKGTDLKVDRIYIRKGNAEYDSITFYVKNGYLRGARFWAKLDDVNTLEFK